MVQLHVPLKCYNAHLSSRKLLDNALLLVNSDTFRKVASTVASGQIEKSLVYTLLSCGQTMLSGKVEGGLDSSFVLFNQYLVWLCISILYSAALKGQASRKTDKRLVEYD